MTSIAERDGRESRRLVSSKGERLIAERSRPPLLCPLEVPSLATDGHRAMLMIEPLTLRSSAKMPVVGLGTWKIPREVCRETVLEAIRTGYRHLDCACDCKRGTVEPQREASPCLQSDARARCDARS